MMKKTMVLLLLGFFMWIGFGGVAFSGDTASGNNYEHAVMRPDPETLHQWLDDFEFMEKAHIDTAVASRLTEAGAQNLGTSMSLLSRLKYTPSERNQSSCGDCWVWAGTGVMEIDLDVQKNIYDRLSTQFLNSCRTPFACCGGSLTGFANWYSSQQKAIPWSNTNASFQDGSTQCVDSTSTSSVPCSSISTTPNYPITSIAAAQIVTQGVSQATAIANIKNILQQNKAVDFDFWLGTKADWQAFYAFWDNQTESDVWDPDVYCGHTWSSTDGAGHAVMIVGYDDTASTPYWVVLNSWGTTSGRPNGLFRMKMNMDYSCIMHQTGYSDWYSREFSTLNIQWGAASSYAITSPTPGSTLSSTSVTFQWNSGAAEYWLQIGSSVGASNYYNSGSLGTSTSTTATGLPSDGSTVYVRLWYRTTSGGSWAYTDCTYKATSSSGYAITSPTPGSTLSSTSVTFQWNSGAAEYWLYAGSSAGAYNYYSSGSLGTSTSTTVTGLPSDGSTIYVRLWYRATAGGSWAYTDCTYKASSTGGYAIISPTPGTTLSSTSVTFQWNSGAAEYWMFIGSSVGGYNYYYSGSLGTSTTTTVKGLPSDGSTIYVRLWYRVTAGGSWAYTDCTYKATSTGGYAIISPTPGSTLTSTSVTFQWNSGAAEYWMFIGSSVGGYNYYYSGSLGTSTTTTVTGLPSDGSTIYVRLWYRATAGGTWAYTDCTFKATSSGGGGFNEQFKSSASNWLQDSGSWNIAYSEYYYTAGTAGFSASSTYNQTYTNLDYSAKLWRYGNDTSANRLIVRASGSVGSDGHFSNEYTFQCTRDGSYSVYKRVGGVSTALQDWTSSSAINQGNAWNTLRVVAAGSSFYFYINGTLAWSGADTGLTSGRVGVGMYLGAASSADGFYVDWATLTVPSSTQIADSIGGQEAAAPVQNSSISSGNSDSSGESRKGI